MTPWGATMKRRVAKGLCALCGRPKATEKRNCVDCGLKIAAYEVKRREAKTAKGLCITGGCKRKHLKDNTKCRKHRDMMRAVTAKHYHNRKGKKS